MRQFNLKSTDKNWQVFTALFKPQNQLLYQRIAAVWEALFKPSIVNLIATGVEEKAFDTCDPEGAAELLLGLNSLTYPIVASAFNASTLDLRRGAITILERRLRLHGIAIDRLLDLPDGSVAIIEPDFPDAFMAAPPPSQEKAS